MFHEFTNKQLIHLINYDMWYSIQSSDLINWSGSGEQILTVIWNNCLYVFKVVLPIVVPILYASNNIFLMTLCCFGMEKFRVAITVSQPKYSGPLLPHSSFSIQEDINFMLEFSNPNFNITPHYFHFSLFPKSLEKKPTNP